VQVDSIKTRVERIWLQRLTLQYDEPLSNFAFNFNLSRYTAAVQALPVIARLLAVPRMATRCEAAWGFYWIGRLRSSRSGRRRPAGGVDVGAGAQYSPHDAGISATERECIVPLLELLSEGGGERTREGAGGGEDGDGAGDGAQYAVVVVTDDASEFAGVGVGRGNNIDSSTGEDSGMNVAEAAAAALSTMPAVPGGAAAILDADLVGRCRLTVSNPVVKAPTVQRLKL